ncbi:hypothetical protein O181_035096 [Austropuccinia psidii MF-1]|uniref:Trehalose-phosphatase n=1 Tax=Austropuccinia psidii MF-1 TaxID=1389203 RepID=A0A9Q3D7M7_9BASI|nr:hypothetical protein [Austropuccinia psidii MF-1]
MHSKPMIPSRLYILKLLFFILSFQLEPILSVKIDASSAIDILAESHNSYPTQTYRGDANTWFPSKIPLDTNEMVTRFQKASKRVLVLDVDGTMIKFHTDINQAVPTDDLKKPLAGLNEHANTHVSIISGRRKADLATHFDRYNNFKLSAEHGGFVRNPNGEWHSPVEVDSSWMSQASTIMQSLSQRLE